MLDDLFIMDDDFLTKEEKEKVVEVVMKKTAFYFLDKGGAADDGIRGISGSNFIDAPVLINSSLSEYEVDSLFNTSKHVLTRFLDKHDIKIKEITRSRANLSYPSIDRRHTPPHVDDSNDHYTFIYYLNDSDGDTNLYNEHCDNITVRTQDDLTLFKSITPKAGLGVFFNGSRFHTWQPPFNTKARFIINMNVLIEERNV
jgi:hypothetical protein